MTIVIEITTGPIKLPRTPPVDLPGVIGARVEFTGVVRGEEDGRRIAALEYEAYTPMAERLMRAILDDLGRQHPCRFVRVTHRVGLVPVGEAAIHVEAAAPHRGAALAMVAEFMNRLKQDVPIWKRRTLPEPEPTGTRR